MKIRLSSFILVIFIAGAAFAQENKTIIPPDDAGSEIQKKVMEEEKKRREQYDRLSLQQKEELRKIKERQQTINKIVSAFREGGISLEDAKQRLRPLIKLEVEKNYPPDIIEARLTKLLKQEESLKKEIDLFTRAKKNPQILIDQKINAYLQSLSDTKNSSRK